MAMDVLDLLFYTTMYLSLFVSLFWFSVVFSYERKKRAMPLSQLTILVPAYNKAATIGKCLDSLLAQDYPGLEIVVIDDGSRDGTAAAVKQFRSGTVRYLRTRNAGKAAALNHGLRTVTTGYFGFIDADTYLAPGALHTTMRSFTKNVACVIAAIRPETPRNFVERLQKIEYAISSFTRKLMGRIDAVYYTPGFAVYRTDVIRRLGGFDEHNITEDLEIGLRLRRHGYSIGHSDAYVTTTVPATLGDLFVQRIRWYRGYIYNTRNYSSLFFNRKFGDLGVMILPMQYILLALVSVLFLYSLYDMAIGGAKALVDLFIVNFDVSYLAYSAQFNPITPTTFFWGVFFASFVLMLAFSERALGEKSRKTDYLLYLFMYPLLNIILWISAFVYELRGAKRRW